MKWILAAPAVLAAAMMPASGPLARPTPKAPAGVVRIAVISPAFTSLDAQIEAISVMANFIWTLERFTAFITAYSKLYPERAAQNTALAARWRSDQDDALDVYTRTLLQIATGPNRASILERITAVRDDMESRSQLRLRAFLPVAQRHVLQILTGQTPSRDDMRDDILAVASSSK